MSTTLNNRPPWIITWLLAAALIYVTCCKVHGDDVPALTGAYQAEVVSVHDGDTCTLRVLLGFDMERNRTAIRLVGVYAPELKQAGGTEATVKLQELLPVGSIVIVRPVRTVMPPRRELMSFGRYVARIWNKDGLDVCDAMVRWLAREVGVESTQSAEP
jgi:endonuclease YncB( thermonuclease family)